MANHETAQRVAVDALIGRIVDVSSPAAGGATLIRRLDGVYAERTLMILALTSLFPSGTRRAPVAGMSKAFEMAVYVDTPAGQMSWHVHEDDIAAFAHLPPYPGEWDGHSTEEKYRRMSRLSFAKGRKDTLPHRHGGETSGQDNDVISGVERRAP